MSTDGVRSVAGMLRDGSESAAKAGVAVARLVDGLPPPSVGRGVATAVGGLSAAWTAVLDDLVAGLVQLATWMDDAVTVTVTVDDDTAGVFRGILR